MEPQGSHVAVPEAVGHTELSTTALARLLASGIRDELLAITREMSNATPSPSGSPTAPTRPPNCWASPQSSSMTCCAPAN